MKRHIVSTNLIYHGRKHKDRHDLVSFVFVLTKGDEGQWQQEETPKATTDALGERRL